MTVAIVILCFWFCAHQGSNFAGSVLFLMGFILFFDFRIGKMLQPSWDGFNLLKKDLEMSKQPLYLECFENQTDTSPSARVQLASSAEEWDARLAECADIAAWDPDLKSPQAEAFLSQQGVRSRYQGVQVLFNKHFTEKIQIVKPETYCPGRTREMWKGTTRFMSEHYLWVSRSDCKEY